VFVTSVVWLTTTFVTAPEDRETLQRFYDKIRPMGRGWRRVVDVGVAADDAGSVTAAFLAWFLGCRLVYGCVFATGLFLYGRLLQAGLALAVAVASAAWLFRVLPRIQVTD
jgi:hypothetical protein